MADNVIAVSHEIVDFHGREKRLEICVGDVAACQGQEVDFLVFSAFPDDYLPIHGTLIARLRDAGIVVSDLAREKERDWRQTWQCWVSRPIVHAHEPIRRIVCFEHGTTVSPASAVGNVFRTVRESLLEDDKGQARLIRVPLLSSGDQGYDRSEMMRAILRQAYLHLLIVDKVEKIQFFLLPGAPDLSALLVNVGVELEKTRLEFLKRETEISYDYFISYRQVDSVLKDGLVHSIKSTSTRRPQGRHQLLSGHRAQTHWLSDAHDQDLASSLYA